MQASTLTTSTTETWLMVSFNQQHLLITKALRATSIGCHLLVNSILPVTNDDTLKVDDYTITSKHNNFCLSVFIVDLSLWPPERTKYVPWPPERTKYVPRWQPTTCEVKRATKDYKDITSSPIRMEMFSYPLVSRSSIKWKIFWIEWWSLCINSVMIVYWIQIICNKNFKKN